MSKTAIIKTGEKFFIKQLSRSQPIKLDKVIFANISGINGDTEIDLDGSMPDNSQIVHTAPVTQSGLLNDKTVVYSVILDTSVGDFSFNYIGLANSETNTLCMVMHTDLTRKIKTAGQRQGNTITESIWLEIDNASESTGITVNAETWQIDYSNRLAGEDERIRLTNYDLYDRLSIHNGFEITKNGNQLTVAPGLAYVAGLRVEHTTQTPMNIENNQSLYIDACLAGTATGEWSVNYNLIAGTNLRDYEKNGFKHYVECIASVDESGKLIVIKPKSFITTFDRATTEKAGIVQLSSAIDSESESYAATPRAINEVARSALKNTGGTVTGTISAKAPVVDKIPAVEKWKEGLGDKSIISSDQWAIFNGIDYPYLGGTSNMTIASWWGVGFAPLYSLNNQPQNNTVSIDCRAGTVNARGGFFEDGIKLVKEGDVVKKTLTIESNNAFRLKNTAKNISTVVRFEGEVFWILFTDKNNSDGDFNHLRPFSISATTGRANFQHGVSSGGVPVLRIGDYGIGTKAMTTSSTNRPVGSAFIAITSTDADNPAVAGGVCGFQSFSTNNGWGMQLVSTNNANEQIRLFARAVENDKEVGRWNEIITDDAINSYLPVGIPQPWPAAVPPAGWIECDGTIFDKNKYPLLAKAYPGGRLPDLRSEFIRGWDNGREVDIDRNILTAQGDQARNAVGFFYSKNRNSADDTLIKRVETASHGGGEGNGSASKHVIDFSNVWPTGTEFRPRNVAFMYIVKAA